MKYCIPYYKDFRYFDRVDEIILDYKEHNDNIINFVSNKFSQKQRIIVDIAGKTKEIKDILPILKKLYREHEFMSVRIPLYAQDLKSDNYIYEYVQDAGIAFFFNEFCRTEDEVYALIKRGVSDVYIVENLAFNIEEVGRYCHEADVSVRMIPNMAQYPLHEKNIIPAAYKFFIRPEDVDIYSSYVDTFEFVGPLDRMSVLFNIYKSKQWLGDLNDLILGLDEEFLNNGTVPYFGRERIKCKHKCMLGKCNLCSEMQKIAKQFEHVGVQVKRERDNSWKNERKIDEETLYDEKETVAEGASEVPTE